MITAFCFCFIILAVVVTWQQVRGSPRMRGIMGEYTVRKKLGFLDRTKYTLIHDVTIRSKNGKLSQIDHIVVSPYGVFVIETKNYTGKIYGNDYMQEWAQYFGKRRLSVYNPVKQNNGHLLTLKGLLGGDVKLISVIAFCKEADLHVTSKSAEVVYADYLPKLIKNYTELVISSAHLVEIVEKIESNSLRGRDIRQEHIQQVQKVTRQRYEKADITEIVVARSPEKRLAPVLNPETCPKCGSVMIERTSKYGKFMSCSDFSDCKR